MSGHALYAQNPFSGIGANVNQSYYQEQQQIYTGDQDTNRLNQMKKPPSSQSHQSHFQMLRESREKERHENLANVSKQIVSPEPSQQHYVPDDQSSKSGLPPSGQSPLKKKQLMEEKRQLKIPKQPVKPPSNYSKASR